MKKRATLVRVDGRNHEDVIEYAVMHDNGTELGLVRLDSAADEWVAVLFSPRCAARGAATRPTTRSAAPSPTAPAATTTRRRASLMPESRFHSPCPEIVIPTLTVALAALAPDYFEHAALHHLAQDTPPEVVELLGALHVAQQAALVVEGLSVVSLAEDLLRTEGGRA